MARLSDEQSEVKMATPLNPRGVALTLEFLKSILHYNPETGVWTYLVSRRRAIRVGSIAGSLTHDGYHRILVNRKQYLSHRLAFFYTTGEWPKELVDHINGNKLDNRWCNLREANHSQNGQNKAVGKNNKSGLKGVRMLKSGKYAAYLCLGSFETKEEAKAIYDEAAVKLHGVFYRQ